MITEHCYDLISFVHVFTVNQECSTLRNSFNLEKLLTACPYVFCHNEDYF